MITPVCGDGAEVCRCCREHQRPWKKGPGASAGVLIRSPGALHPQIPSLHKLGPDWLWLQRLQTVVWFHVVTARVPPQVGVDPGPSSGLCLQDGHVTASSFSLGPKPSSSSSFSTVRLSACLSSKGGG